MTIAIIGLGLIGGSLGLALKRAGQGPIVGCALHPRTLALAQELGAIDLARESPEAAVEGAGLVILAAPIRALPRLMARIAPHLLSGAVVTDTASTKASVMKWATEDLPRGVYFVGGHPMAGKEKSGPQAAEETLFDGRPYCIVPSVDAVPGAVNSVIGLAETLGARPFFLDADEHDAYAAAISHVPLVASL
ncbi:MAG TPA: prephenate dehydrogenase/arogenate dehydrogenase family protein, partial [Dehalococcoidia bacterium]|nr:prephenate dehydrogenase/arogenate dehydrogenase family protein [Dehalococcoidia bacterium]